MSLAWNKRGSRSACRPRAIPTTTPKPRVSSKRLKREEVYLKDYQTFAEAEANLAHFIEAVYNVKRLHSSLGYLPPAEFEAAYFGSMAELTCPVVR